MKSLKKVRKKIFNRDVKMMKKALYVGLIVAIFAFFTLPSMIFANEGDVVVDEEVVEETSEESTEEGADETADDTSEDEAEEPAEETGEEVAEEESAEGAKGEETVEDEEIVEESTEGAEEEVINEESTEEEAAETGDDTSKEGAKETEEEVDKEGSAEDIEGEEVVEEGAEEDSASIYTEEEKYHPGDIVPVVGAGFAPGEELEIAFYNADDELEHIGKAVADENGNILYEYTISGSKQYTVIVKSDQSEAEATFDDDPVADYEDWGPKSGRMVTSGLSLNFYMEYFVVDIYQGTAVIQDDDMYAFCVDLEHYINHDDSAGVFEWEVISFEDYNIRANSSSVDTIYELPWTVKALAMGIDKDWVENGSPLSWLSDTINALASTSSVGQRTAALQAAFWHLGDKPGNTRFNYTTNAPSDTNVQNLTSALVTDVVNIPAGITIVNTVSGTSDTELNYVHIDDNPNTHSFTASVYNYNDQALSDVSVLFGLVTNSADARIDEADAATTISGDVATSIWTGVTGASGQVEIPIKFYEFISSTIETTSNLTGMININLNPSYESGFITSGGSILYPLSDNYPGDKENSNQTLIVIDTENPTDSIDKTWRVTGEVNCHKTDSNSGASLGGAVFSLLDSESSPATDAWGNPVDNQTTDGSGYALFENLAWGDYIVREESAPSGYYTTSDTPVTVQPYVTEDPVGTVTTTDVGVANDPIPPTPPKPPTDPPTTPSTTTTAVAGIIEVAGISELPFTGMNPIIPISGISIMVIGAALLMVYLIRRKRIKRWKHELVCSDIVKD